MQNSNFNSLTPTPLGGGGRQITRVIRTPWLTLAIGVLSIGLGICAEFHPLLEWLCFDYEAITLEQQYWRLITGHLIHSSYDHLLWDLLAFTACGYYVEIKNGQSYLFTIVLTTVGLNLFLLSPYASVAQYSGLSGILYAIMILAAWHWIQQHRGILAWLPISIVIVKTVLEAIQQENTFVSDGWSLFFEAHLIGMAMGGMSLVLLKCNSLFTVTYCKRA